MTAVAHEAAKPVPDIQAWELFPGTHILGNCVLDRYVIVPSAGVPVLLEAIRAIDGERTLEEISSELRARGYAVDMRQLHARLWKAGLIEGAPYQGDVTRFSICWASLGTARFFGLIPRSGRFLAWVSAASAVMAVLALWLSVAHRLNLFSSFRTHVPAGPIEFAGVLLAGIVLSVIAHEGAHGLTASRFGRVPTRLRALGYFGFIPCFVLSIPGLYTLPAKKRIAVWIAGPVGSLTAAACAILIGELPHMGLRAHVWMDQFAAVNLGVALYNCCPLLPTDGYFVLSTLLGRANMRARAWQEWKLLFRGIRRPNTPLLIYGLISVAFLVIVIGRNIRLLLVSTGYSLAGYAIVAILAGAICVKRFRKLEAGRK